jgi:hypothetical protein
MEVDENLTWNIKWQLMDNVPWSDELHAKPT